MLLGEVAMNEPDEAGTGQPLIPLLQEFLKGEVLEDCSELILLECGGEDDRVKQSIGLSEGLLVVEVVPFLQQLFLDLVE